MGKGQTIRIVTALTVIGIGVPLTVIANNRAGLAGTDIGNVAAQAGSTISGATGTSVGSATGSSATSSTSGTTATSASGSGSTTNLPADKMTVAGSNVEVATPDTDVVVLQAQMRTSNVADLVFQVSSECSIVTDVTNTGDTTSSAEGTIQMWVTVDDKPVGVIPGTQGQSDTGMVTFCNRKYSTTTSGFLPTQTIETYEATKSANAFNWVAMNVGSGVHTIKLHAMLTHDETGTATDSMVVGNRTLVVNTTQTAQNQAQ
jgi:hypothetical protein